ncbi:J domain-containing protein [Pseudonocardia sp. ICBG601]|uniref:J domain-containing protein n=1 Tax=Pseudonocardia sp. ICBG601 TaxID=2846759 RepID=UPI001CF65861|nr:J domain-containing protein [Pseudonocardia sp. ICBG601]
MSGQRKVPKKDDYQEPSLDKAARLLGVSPAASPQVLHAAYREKAKVHHPDSGGDEDQFKALHEAYKLLLEQGWSAPAESLPEQSDTGPVVWVRSRVPFLLFVVGLGQAFLVLLVPFGIGVASLASSFLLTSVLVVCWYLWVGSGRPTRRSVQKKIGEARGGGDRESSTDPLDAMTAERVERFERDGY